MTENNRDIIVIGAGISGLACAFRLKSLGVDVLLLEISEKVGGVIQSERIGDFLIERGPNSSQGAEELLSLVEELGINDEMVEGDPKAPAYVYFRRRLHPVPSSPAAFLGSRLLSLRGKLRILLEPFIPVRRSETEESVFAFARRRIGREAAERMVAPFVSGIYAGDADQLSVKAAFPKLSNLEAEYGGLIRGTIAKAREARSKKKSVNAVLDKAAPARRRLISFKNGMLTLPQTLASRLGEDLITGCTRISLSAISSQTAKGINFSVAFERGGVFEKLSCKEVVIATPSGAAATLIHPISEELSELLKEIKYPPLSILSIAYDSSKIKTPLNGFGFLVAPSEGLNILGCVWNSSLFPGRAPSGKTLLTVFIGGARNPESARRGDDELLSMAHKELRDVLGISGEPQLVAVTRWERAIPQYGLGHHSRVQRIEEILKDLKGLHLAGNYLHGVSTGDCVKEALETAEKLAKSVKSN